jgi:bifunctional DNA-binding transcriptional regulator/antitoxin component of YhaV-PrlF toxin-antitoxin module
LRKHFIARVAAGHRVTIPNEVCQVLGIKNGNLVEVDLDVVVVLPKIEDKLVGGTMKWK